MGYFAFFALRVTTPFTSRHGSYRRLVIWLLMAAVVVLLVAPQVDFPAAVNGHKTPLVSGLAHAGSSVNSALNALSAGLHSAFSASGFAAVSQPLLASHPGADRILVRLCTLRC